MKQRLASRAAIPPIPLPHSACSQLRKSSGGGRFD